MKINELRSIIREVIVEEMTNESVNKKKVAIAEIKRIIAENKLSEDEVNEVFGLFKSEERKKKEEAELKANKDRLTDQFNELKDKLNNKKITIDQALALAARFKDDFKGNFILVKGVLNYKGAKSENPLQDKTGGSSGFGTAIS